MAISKELNRGRHLSFCNCIPLGLHHQVSIAGLGRSRGRPPAAAVRQVCTDFESPLTEMWGRPPCPPSGPLSTEGGHLPSTFSRVISSSRTSRADVLRSLISLCRGPSVWREPPDTSTVKTIMTAKPETLEATLDRIDKTYGSFGNYLRDVLKLSDADLSTLRRRLLEP